MAISANPRASEPAPAETPAPAPAPGEPAPTPTPTETPTPPPPEPTQEEANAIKEGTQAQPKRAMQAAGGSQRYSTR